MQPIVHPNATHTFTKPSEWDSDIECSSLSVIYDGETMYSYWRVSWLECLKILFSRQVRLSVYGFQHPSVSLDTEQY